MGQDPGSPSRNIHNRILLNSSVGAKASPRWKMVILGWAQASWNTALLRQFSSVAQSCSTLCNPMDCSMPGFPVYHQLPELAQTHVHQANDAIQLSHPLSSPSPSAFNLSQYQGLFQWVSSSHQVARVLEFQLQHQSFSEYSRLISFRMDWLDLLAVQGTLKIFSNTTVEKHQFFSAQLSL